MAELLTWAPTVTSVLASAEACDRVGDLPGACRVSPGEVALVGDVSEAAVAAAFRVVQRKLHDACLPTTM